MSDLINNDTAKAFMQLARTETGCKAYLGDAETYDSAVGPEIVNSNIALRTSAEKVFALGEDDTRTEVQKHEAAQFLANQTVAQLEKAKLAIEQRADMLYTVGLTNAKIQFAPSESRAQLDSEIRAYIREEAKKPNGIAKIRQLMLSDRDVASVVYHSNDFLLGIESSLHTGLRFDAIKQFCPQIYADMNASLALSELSPRYAGAIGSVRQSFFNGAIAAKASKRVNL